MTKVLLGATIVLAGLHEALAWRTGARRGLLPAIRRVVLLTLVAVAAFGGDVASVRTRVNGLLEDRSADARVLPYDASGDALLKRRLAAQVPAHPFPTGGGRDEVEAWRSRVTEQLRVRVGFSAARADDVQSTVVSTEVVGGAVRRTLLTFTAADGTHIPAYLHEPLEGSRRAGLLVVPGHGAGARSTAGLVPEDYQHAAALALARRGLVTLTPELRGFGMLSPAGVPTHRAVALAALESGTSYKAVVVQDLARALTVLERWPGVDPGRLGVAGASLGGELAVLLGVLDSRVRVVASQSYGGSTGPTTVADDGNDESQQTPHGCHTMPGVNELVAQEDWFRLIAPRPLLVTRGRRNTPREAEAFVTAVAPAFEVAGARARFVFTVEEGGHEFFVAPVVRFLEASL